jgi:hypothetical protein
MNQSTPNPQDQALEIESGVDMNVGAPYVKLKDPVSEREWLFNLSGVLRLANALTTAAIDAEDAFLHAMHEAQQQQQRGLSVVENGPITDIHGRPLL